MATIYVRSIDGNNADDGSTWALAKLDGAGAAAIDAAGDTIYFSDAHAESTAGTVTWTLAGTLASPVKLICGDDAAEPPTAVSTAGTVTTTGTGPITINGCCYVHGLTFNAGSGAVNAAINLAGSAADTQTWKACSFIFVATGSACNVLFGPQSANQVSSYVTWIDCTVKFAHASCGLAPAFATFNWCGGSVLSGGTSPTSLFLNLGGNGRTAYITVSGVDLSNLSSTVNLVTLGAGQKKVVFSHCKLPASWSGSLAAGTMLIGDRVSMYNCDSASTNYREQVEDYAGTTVQETTVVMTGGASDGTTALSWKMTTKSTALYPLTVMRSDPMVVWNDSTSSITVTVELVHDTNVAAGQGAGASSAFQNDEFWIEVLENGDSGSSLGTWNSSCKADVLATAADITSSSQAWTTTGLTTVVKQKMQVTFTPGKKGPLLVYVCGAKASKTIYYNTPSVA